MDGFLTLEFSHAGHCHRRSAKSHPKPGFASTEGHRVSKPLPAAACAQRESVARHALQCPRLLGCGPARGCASNLATSRPPMRRETGKRTADIGKHDRSTTSHLRPPVFAPRRAIAFRGSQAYVAFAKELPFTCAAEFVIFRIGRSRSPTAMAASSRADRRPGWESIALRLIANLIFG